ncbi:MAG: PilZ domain-containing protein [Steroidobacteraceae bacterium]
MEDGIDTIVLDEELAYIDVVPLRWTALPRPVDPDIVVAQSEQNLRLLQALAALDDRGPAEKTDENSPHSADLMRLDFKVNLLLDLVGQILLKAHPRPAAMPMRFNVHGAIWRAQDGQVKAGEAGQLELWLRAALVEPLRLFGRVVSVGVDRRVKLRFEPLGKPVGDLIEKLTFQRHRRQVAGTRERR